jgi:hypothetical protein
LIETDYKVGDAIALQQALGGGQSDAEIAVIHFLEAGVDYTDDLHIDSIESAVGGNGEKREPVAWLDVHGTGDTSANEGFNLAAGFGVEVSARFKTGSEAERVFGNGINGAAHEDAGFYAVRKHAIELDAGGNSTDMAASLDGCGDLSPVVDAGVEDMLFFAVEVLGGEDLNVAETVIDRAFAQAPKHSGEEAADEKEAGNASSNHDQGHDGAAAIAEDVTKG